MKKSGFDEQQIKNTFINTQIILKKKLLNQINKK